MDFIKNLGLKALPEKGGWIAEIGTPKTPGMVALKTMGPSDPEGSSSILFMLKGNDFAAWHRLESDEYFCHHTGGVMRVHQLDPENGTYKMTKIGPVSKWNEGVVPQYMVKRGVWFAQDLEDKDSESFSLVSCIVVPEFTWSKFELGKKELLISQFPNFKHIISNYCR